MLYDIVNCSGNDAEFICDRLVEYNLKQVAKTQQIDFVNINKKIVDENNNIVAGCLAKMYCWNVIYIDVLWVDDQHLISKQRTFTLNMDMKCLVFWRIVRRIIVGST